jgi:hypothetical protein
LDLLGSELKTEVISFGFIERYSQEEQLANREQNEKGGWREKCLKNGIVHLYYDLMINYSVHFRLI